MYVCRGTISLVNKKRVSVESILYRAQIDSNQHLISFPPSSVEKRNSVANKAV